MHFHGAAYNVQFFGTKRWMLIPPRYTAISGAPSTSFTALAKSQLPAGLPLRCVQGPGDMLILPSTWGHATINSGFNLGIGNLFCDRAMTNLTMTDGARCGSFPDISSTHPRASIIRPERVRRPPRLCEAD
jgi:hypothetical protein